jgi:alkanesulfonate monooxygenase SsuD/methylene tetrahydromethanopterin reductase-like flavin-dependent oxidoreductase (luciferase family)
MIFDLFHSVGDPAIGVNRVGSAPGFVAFESQVRLAEAFGVDTIWTAESHFSSEVQKTTSVATIPNFVGEVGLNSDSFQLMHWLQSRTQRVGFGTAIHNIVGGSGGPIASADRVNTLSFYNEKLWATPREIRIGVAAGRFPYQNTPFGIVPRDATEADFWPIIRRYVFLEALEIFLRLLRGEALSSADVTPRTITEKDVTEQLPTARDALLARYRFPLSVRPRWEFEKLKLVPEFSGQHLHIVLGSADPLALDVAYRFWPVDLFNLSFTPPDQIEKLHSRMEVINRQSTIPWKRSRLPRTVLVFIDPDAKKARRLASSVLDTYIEAMRGTAAVPDKDVLLSRALVGDAAQIRDQLSPEDPRGFHPEDRLMLWFEFNQLETAEVEKQMRYFFEQVVAKP